MRSLITFSLLAAFGLAFAAGDKPPTLDDVIGRLDSKSAGERSRARLELLKIARGSPDILATLKQRAAVADGHAKAALDRQIEWLAAPELSSWWDVLFLYDALGLPPVTDRQFVLLNTGGWSISGRTDFRFVYVLGFVDAEDESSRTLVSRHLAVETHARKCELPESWDKYRANHPETLPLPGKVKEIDFEKFCRDFLDGGVQDYFGALDHAASGGQEHPGEAALYGYWAWQRGAKPLAKELFQLAEKSMEYFREHRGGGEAKLAEFLRDSLAGNVRWRAIKSANRGADRKELLGFWQTVEGILPPDETKEAIEMAGLYRRMLAEDEAWVEPTEDVLDGWPAEKQAAYWLHHLRDLAETQWSQPGSCSVFGYGFAAPDDGKSGKHPAWRLHALGFAAVPLLIEHLDDPRPTRCMGYWRHFAPDTFYLLRYGDACQEILSRIAGRTFFMPRSTNSYMAKDGETSSVKRDALAWWKEVHEKGELRLLTEGTASGDRSSPGQGRMLLDKYPESALGPLVTGLKASTDARTRCSLVALIGRIPGEDPIPTLLVEMKEGPLLRARVSAASALSDRRREEAAAAMVVEWKRRPAGVSHLSYGSEALIQFLVRHGGVAGIAALGEFGEDRPIPVRYEILDAIREGLDRETADAEVQRAAEDVVAAALIDRRVRAGLSCAWGDVHFRNPRLCDFAGLVLSRLFPERWEFDIMASHEERDRRIQAIRKAWRESRKLGPEPESVRVEAVPAEQLQPLLDAISNATDAAALTEATRRVEALGLAALPGVRKAGAGFDGLARRLAAVVSETKILSGSLPVPEEVRAHLSSLEGKPLTTANYVWFLRHWRKHAKNDRRWIRIDAWRHGDGTGVTLALAIESAEGEKPLDPGHSQAQRNVVLGKERLLSATTTGPGGPDSYMLARIRKALGGAPDLAFRIMVALRVRPEND